MVSLETKIRTFFLKYYPLILLSLSISLVFCPLWLGEFYSTSDIQSVFIPLENFFQQEIQHGRLPLWDPNAAWGFPLLASGQLGFFYPPLFFARLILPLFIYLPFLLWGHFLALGFGTYFFLRKTQARTRSASLLSALTFTLSAFIIQHVLHLNIIFAVAYFPWQLILAHQLASRHQVLPTKFLAFVIVLALPFLVGQLQIPFLIATFTSLYYFFHSRGNQTLHYSLATLLLATLSVIALSAVQTLPTLELLQYSERSPGGNFDTVTSNQHSFPLYHLPTFLFPRFFDQNDTYWGKRLEIEYGLFVGVIPFLLAFASLRPAWRSQKFWVVTLIITFLFSLGEFSPFRLVGFEPSLWLFSAPARWLLFTSFSLSVLAAFGLDNLSFRPLFKPSLLIFTFVLFSTLIYNYLIFKQPDIASSLLSLISPADDPYYQQKITSLLHSLQTSGLSLHSPFTWLTLATLALFSFSLGQPKPRRLLVALAALELIIIAGTTHHSLPWTTTLSPPNLVAALPANLRQHQMRLLSIREGGDTGAFLTNPESRRSGATSEQRQLLRPLVNSQFNIPGIEWPASLSLAKHVAILNQLRSNTSYHLTNPALAEKYNIGSLAIPADLDQPDFGIKLAQVGNINLYQLDPAPRAYLQTSSDIKAADYQPLNPQAFQINVTTPSSGFLHVTNTWYPGWTATLNGQAVPLFPDQDQFMNVWLPPGTHQLKFNFTSPSLFTGAQISAAALLLLLATTAGQILKPKLSSAQ
jgi:hypothetical protein